MKNKSKDSCEQIFHIGRSLAREIMNSSDDEILSENVNSQLFANKTLGELTYERALNTVNSKQVKTESGPNEENFNLAEFVLKGINASFARQQIASLSAANDPSLLLVASNVNELSDTEIMNVYKDLLASGVFKLK